VTATSLRRPGVFAPLGRFAHHHRSLFIVVAMTAVSAFLYVASYFPPFSWFQAQNAWIGAFVNAGVFILLAMGLNVVIGMAGLLDLGYAAFFAIGAYFFAYGASSFTGIHGPFLLLLVLGAVCAALFGIVLGAPTLRLRGDYLAIVTLGFGEIVPILFLNLDKYTAGTNGITGVDRPNIFGYQFGGIEQTPYYLLMVITVTLTMVLLYRLQDSRVGRAWMAIREDELAAAANGINTVTTKLLAFAIGATTAGFAGVINASKLTIVDPTQFLFTVSFTILVMVVLGGMGNIWGVAAGAFIIYIIQVVVLKQLTGFFDRVQIPLLSDINFVQFQFLLFGLALVLMMLVRPEGLFPSRRVARVLHAAEEAEAAADEEAEALEAAPVAETPSGETLAGTDR
jgi:ABC-type branched-subunit amino acid transport system permease subunit